jgi:hypothetical protein
MKLDFKKGNEYDLTGKVIIYAKHAKGDICAVYGSDSPEDLVKRGIQPIEVVGGLANTAAFFGATLTTKSEEELMGGLEDVISIGNPRNSEQCGAGRVSVYSWYSNSFLDQKERRRNRLNTTFKVPTSIKPEELLTHLSKEYAIPMTRARETQDYQKLFDLLYEFNLFAKGTPSIGSGLIVADCFKDLKSPLNHKLIDAHLKIMVARTQLQHAVVAEQFEQAAKLRDTIRGLVGSLPSLQPNGSKITL